MNKSLIILLILSILFTAFMIINFAKTDTAKDIKALNKKKNDSNIIETKIPFEEIKLAGSQISLLKPKPWHTYQERSSNGLNYYITPYKYDDLAKFIRGLAVTIIMDVSKTEGITADEYALSCIKNAKTIDKKLKLTKVNIQHLKGYLFRIEGKERTPNSLVTSFLFVADNKYDIFYTFIFQYERKNWKETFPIRNTIFKNIKFTQ